MIFISLSAFALSFAAAFAAGLAAYPMLRRWMQARRQQKECAQ